VAIFLAKTYKGSVKIAIAPGLEAADGASTRTAIVSSIPWRDTTNDMRPTCLSGTH
jgi:hypothetical protein